MGISAFSLLYAEKSVIDWRVPFQCSLDKLLVCGDSHADLMYMGIGNKYYYVVKSG
jgi:hypothetical protein